MPATSESAVSILLVDDRPENLLALEASLAHLGHHLVKAHSGREALRALLEHDYALILLDVAMPELDGYEVAALIRERERSRTIPIIFLTANYQSDTNVFRGYSVGAVDYLFKPFVPEVLRSKVEVFVELYNKREMLRLQSVALQLAHDEMEEKVRERTAQLRTLNRALEAEIIERRRAEADRAALFTREQAARLEAETANRMKDEFLATLSHELRTPLNAILGWSQLLGLGTLDAATTARAFEVIRRSALAQSQLIADLLDVSRIIGGKLRLNLVAVDPRASIQAALDAIQPGADAKGITIETQLHMSETMLADGDRLQQVLWNLLSNAIRFTPRNGKVQVRLERSGADIQIQVADNGEGIHPDFLPHVFERFTQADSSASRTHGGLGIGLAIVRHVVELHGGTVSVASAGSKQGATFTVTLPLRDAAAASSDAALQAASQTGAPPASGGVDLAGISVLAVDDDEDSVEVVRLILSERGAQVATVNSAAAALLAVSRAFPDVLISDIGMPVLDGCDLLREIRRRFGPDLPAIALSAYAAERDEAAIYAAGFNRYLTKPVDAATLGAAVVEVVRGAEATAARAHGGREQAPSAAGSPGGTDGTT